MQEEGEREGGRERVGTSLFCTPLAVAVVGALFLPLS